MHYLCIAFLRKERAFSSAGSEHLPYKQRVGGSNPSTPTKQKISYLRVTDFFIYTHTPNHSFLHVNILQKVKKKSKKLSFVCLFYANALLLQTIKRNFKIIKI